MNLVQRWQFSVYKQNEKISATTFEAELPIRTFLLFLNALGNWLIDWHHLQRSGYLLRHLQSIENLGVKGK